MKMTFTIAVLVVFGLLVGGNGSAQMESTMVDPLMGIHGTAPYPPPAFRSSGVYAQDARTYFWAFINGPSPEDVASLTVTGPSGTFDLTPFLSFRQRGLMYFHWEDSILEDGEYNFNLTDGFGRTTTVFKYFTYDGTVPHVNSDTMLPRNGAYVGNTSPTLNFDPVMGENVYYQVFVEDYGSQAVWYSSSHSRDTSFTVPEGLLQPNTPYWWNVRVWDEDSRNRTQTDRRFFFTGTKAIPDIVNAHVLSFPYGGYVGNWFGVTNIPVAPWDLESRWVTGPDSTLYELDRVECRFDTPALYHKTVVKSEPTPDGTYEFGLTDDEGNVGNATRSYVYDPVPGVSEESLSPDDNAYFDSARPTFSWSPVEGDNGAHDYQLRVHDYTQEIKWYTSERSEDTTVTIPEGVNLPRGSSYKWQVLVWDKAINNLNLSSARTFTITTSGPVVSTGSVEMNFPAAILNGTVNPKGADTNYHFEYGTNQGYGCTTAIKYAGAGNEDIPATGITTCLLPAETYHYRIVATDTYGTTYGDDKTFRIKIKWR
jgi:hypothetical protein